MDTPSLRKSETAVSIADYLLSRRDAILQTWRLRCDQDPSLAHTIILDRREFDDHVPMLLQVLEQRLSDETEVNDPERIANYHGFHRWRWGRGLNELITEICYLYEILHTEVMRYHELFGVVSATAMANAFVQIARTKEDTIRGSISEYVKQEQKSANRRMAGLEQALDNLSQLGRVRGEVLRSSSHDLKSGFGVIQGVTTLLEESDKPEPERAKLFEMLKRNLYNLQDMLEQLTDLSRLEAGKESMELDTFDASAALRETIEGIEPLARDKDLKLLAGGPDSLIIQGDKVKLLRIVQNLLMNSVKHTAHGVVSVSWSAVDNFRWYIGIQDSGPGLPTGVSDIFGGSLRPIIDAVAVLNPDSDESSDVEDPPVAETTQTSGEGLGLHIVKNLCDLIQADLVVETKSGEGTLFGIRIPVKYDS